MSSEREGSARAALEQHGLRSTNQSEYHINLAKRLYIMGDIEVEELERRVGLALEGLALLDDTHSHWSDVVYYPGGMQPAVRLRY